MGSCGNFSQNMNVRVKATLKEFYSSFDVVAVVSGDTLVHLTASACTQGTTFAKVKRIGSLAHAQALFLHIHYLLKKLWM